MTLIKTGKYFFIFPGFFLILFYSLGCESTYIRMGDEGTHTAPADTVKLSTHVQPVLYNKCASCHFAGTTLDLESADIYNSLISGNFVDTASPENSRLFSEPDPGHADDYLTVDEHTLIVRWIQQGAKNN
ncbi:MAG: hypothetical protein KBB11_07545 [Bacteroidales bacterium]|nr:hypothetical protein [Bacteroidales bacterium]HOY37711.1 hypothetical protein [Bacteroidales bacterium]HQP04260.1 hypothetical protein [Bacteroidales bacterium]